jgi:hypothetical protein
MIVKSQLELHDAELERVAEDDCSESEIDFIWVLVERWGLMFCLEARCPEVTPVHAKSWDRQVLKDQYRVGVGNSARLRETLTRSPCKPLGMGFLDHLPTGVWSEDLYPGRETYSQSHDRSRDQTSLWSA